MTCSPSIVVTGYHGFLCGGIFTADVEGRSPHGIARPYTPRRDDDQRMLVLRVDRRGHFLSRLPEQLAALAPFSLGSQCISPGNGFALSRVQPGH